MATGRKRQSQRSGEVHCKTKKTALEDEPQIHFHPTDVILEVEGRDIHVNKQVLAEKSLVFKAMFESDFTEKYKEKIPLPGKKYADFVDFLYTFYYPEREEPITENKVLKIIPLAEEYQILAVKDKCESLLREVCQSTARDIEKRIETSTLVNYTACAAQFNMNSVLPFALRLCAECPPQSLKLAGIDAKVSADIQKRIAELRITSFENELKPALTTGSKKNILNLMVLLWDTLNSAEKNECEDRLVRSCNQISSAITLDALLGYIIAAERYNLEKLLTAAIDLASKCTHYKLEDKERYKSISELTKSKILRKRIEHFEKKVSKNRQNLFVTDYDKEFDMVKKY